MNTQRLQQLSTVVWYLLLPFRLLLSLLLYLLSWLLAPVLLFARIGWLILAWPLGFLAQFEVGIDTKRELYTDRLFTLPDTDFLHLLWCRHRCWHCVWARATFRWALLRQPLRPGSRHTTAGEGRQRTLGIVVSRCQREETAGRGAAKGSSIAPPRDWAPAWIEYKGKRCQADTKEPLEPAKSLNFKTESWIAIDYDLGRGG